MPTQVVCPNPGCGVTLSVRSDQVGRRVSCYRCGTKFESIDAVDAGAPDTTLESSRPRAPGASADLPSTFGRYRILKHLGQGGMGAVYLAHDTALDRQVAIKVPHFDLGFDPDVIERFHREARAAAGFHHPNFCPIHDVGQVGETHYLAMAYIEGQALSSRVDRARPMPAREAAKIVRRLALALAEAHRKGIIHRDLKPANVMIDKRGSLIIMDFGLARRTGTDDADLTRSGAMLGTPAYMSPEQVEGARRKVGPATDIYALGVILYELATGRRPFEGSVMTVIGAILHLEPQPPSAYRPDLDTGLEAICLKAIAKKIEDRYPSMEALAQALAENLDRRPDPAPVPASRSPGVLRIAVLAAAGALLIALMGVIGYVATDKGTLKVEGLAPGMDVRVDGREVRIGKVDEPIPVRAGEHGLIVTRGEVVVKAPKTFEVRRGRETVVRLELVLASAAPDPISEAEPAKAPARPESAVARILCDLGDAKSKKGDLDGAMADFNEAIRVDPRSAAAYACRAGIYREKREYDKGLADCDEAIRIDPEHAHGFVERGWIWFDIHEYDRAMADSEEAVRLDPKSAAAHAGRGRIWFVRHEYDKALADAEEAIRLDPKDAHGYICRGNVWHHKKEDDKALADYDEAIRIDPRSVRALENRGNFWLAKKDYDKALADYEEAIRIDPKSALALVNRGRFWRAKGDPAKALADYEEAIRIDRTSSDAYHQRAHIRHDKKEDDLAVADFDEAVRIGPKLSYNYACRAAFWHGKKAYDKSLADYAEAIRIDPKLADAYNRLAWILATCPDPNYRDGRRAVELATRACELASWKDENYLNTLAAAHAEAGDFEAAARRQQEAIGLIADASRKAALGLRLKMYQEKKPFRQ